MPHRQVEVPQTSSESSFGNAVSHPLDDIRKQKADGRKLTADC
jgi:hypothetical protein